MATFANVGTGSSLKYGIGLCSIFLAIYLAFPTANPSSDAWGYAQEILTGKWFSPHHLLHHAWMKAGLLVMDVLGGTSEPITRMQQWNAVGAAFALMGFFLLCARRFGLQTALAFTAFAGSCFGFMRFATENETYIWPIACSVWGSFFLVSYNAGEKKQSLWLAFLLLSLAVLLHQIHIFWLISACVFCITKLKKTGPPIASFVLIGGAYSAVALALGISVFQYPFTDVSAGQVQVIPDLNNLIFTTINFSRTFVQIHGLIPNLFKANWYILPAIIFTALAFMWAVYQFFKSREDNPVKKDNFTGYFRTAFWLQLAFAAYSVGNAEFMVMLPMLLLSGWSQQMGKKLKSIWGLAAALLVYNLFVWVIPANSLLFTGQSGPEIIIRKIPEQSFGFVAMDRVLEENRWAYQISAYKESRPVVYFIQFPGQPEEYEWFKKETNRLFKAGIPVYTDCIDFPHVLNRAAMLHQATDTVFNTLQRKKTAEQRTPRGKWYLYQLTPKSTP